MRVYALGMSDLPNGEAQAQALHRSWGQRIKAKRQGRYSQDQLAVLVGISQAQLSRIERGIHPPTDEQKWAFAGAFFMTVEELFPYQAVVPPFPEAQAEAVA